MGDFDGRMRAWLLLAAVAAVLVISAWVRARRPHPDDARGWKPAQAAIIERILVSRENREFYQLMVRFQTWRGGWSQFVAEVPAWQAPADDSVTVLYDPLRPERAQLAPDGGTQ
ncbi:MAG: hypothetical protein HOU81_25165 [Hamadaea sp.]|uniref:DUF3592 domain-containing protein n=1 Tax=Hamadaea sp. TaxID=2024425 RepID=UPI00185688E3|nr:DUF3592 domain-containing protein [Hamadaea sp.]NUR74112.1 hypothetical protein [Hamadaea sp.]NUT19981.1 hypothetical protein [Hamadaea sp.]